MKYNDHGFIFYYDDYIQLQLLNFGNLVLDLSIYKDKICTNKFQCIAAEKFNKKYINESYEQSFLYDLFISFIFLIALGVIFIKSFILFISYLII